MDGPTLFGKLLEKRGVNPNSLAAALKNPRAQSTFHRFKEGLTKQPKRESLEAAAHFLGVNVLAFYDPRMADEEWARIDNLVVMSADEHRALHEQRESDTVVPAPGNTLDALQNVSALYSKLSPVLLQPARDAVAKWARGEASDIETAATLEAFFKASAAMPKAPAAVSETPVRTKVR